MSVVTTATNHPHGESVKGRQMVSATIASVLGWSLDLYDLFVLLYVAPVLGQVFFPNNVPTLSLAAVYASFAVTLLMRPVGSAIFGSYADKHGRKGAMVFAVVGVGLSTALFGLLPTVQQIGVAAPAIFLLLRLVQGIFVGGVVASTHTIGTESVPPKWRGLVSGLIGGGGAGFGSLFASIIYFIVSSAFPGHAFAVWGWRFMFFSGILSSILGLFVFNSIEESPYWKELKHAQEKAGASQEKTEKSPLKTVLSSKYFPVILVNLMLVIGGGTGYYITSGYLPTFLKVINKTPSSASSMILILASFAAIISAVAIGYFSDLIGRKKTFIIIGIVNCILLPFCYLGLAKSVALSSITLYAVVLAFLGNAGYAPILVFLNERFPTTIRSVGTGLSWNIGFAIGGMMPTFVSLASRGVQSIPSVLSYFAVAVFVLYLIGSFVIPETKGQFK
ncbi:MFS transporter [Fodinisporobacter ferrooxydans]|uniref:MFS transporter n=1 Tax=Fodinisporobacter ferrooxydans TaxID=2901836 RepID=A0ABY4CQG5_9BACL|nr:MFS transporter [Alicyclobacillaceae bacterium MYW30-H2]